MTTWLKEFRSKLLEIFVACFHKLTQSVVFSCVIRLSSPCQTKRCDASQCGRQGRRESMQG